MDGTIRVRSVVWASAAVVLTLLCTLLVMQEWRADAAPGDIDATWVPIEPCRLFDHRPSEEPFGGKKEPLVAGSPATQQVTGTVGNCTIPTSGVVAVSLNVTVVGSTAQSNLRLYPAEAAKEPVVSNLNWKAGDSATANKVDVKLSAAGAVKMAVANGSVNVIGDMVGYYTNSTLKGIAGVPGPAGPSGPVGPAGPSTVNGTVIVPINLRAAPPVTDGTLATLNGITVAVDCEGGEETIKVTTTESGGEIASMSHDPSQNGSDNDQHGAIDDTFSAGDVFIAGPGADNFSSDRQYTITYSAADGRNVTVQLVTEDNIGGVLCVVSGFAMGAP